MKNYVYNEGNTWYAVYTIDEERSFFFGPEEKAFATKKDAEAFLATLKSTSLTVPEKATTYEVNGHTYQVWSDTFARCTYAQDTATGETKKIHGNGYIHAEKTVRKAILISFAPTAPVKTTETKARAKRVLTEEQKAAKAARAKARREARKAAKA